MIATDGSIKVTEPSKRPKIEVTLLLGGSSEARGGTDEKGYFHAP